MNAEIRETVGNVRKEQTTDIISRCSDGIQIEEIEAMKYLGIAIDDKLQFNLNFRLLFISIFTTITSGIINALYECDLKKNYCFINFKPIRVNDDNFKDRILGFYQLTHAVFKSLLFLCAG